MRSHLPRPTAASISISWPTASGRPCRATNMKVSH